MKGWETAKIDVGAGGFLKHKGSSEIEDNEKAILRGASYEPIGYEWMFRILKSEYQEPDGAPIVRPARQLGEMGKAVTRELEAGVRNPEGVWGWLGKKRRGLRSLGINLASREMYFYFKDCTVAKSHTLRESLGRGNKKTLRILRVFRIAEGARRWEIPGKVHKLPKGHWGTFEFRVYRKTICAIGCLR